MEKFSRGKFRNFSILGGVYEYPLLAISGREERLKCRIIDNQLKGIKMIFKNFLHDLSFKNYYRITPHTPACRYK